MRITLDWLGTATFRLTIGDLVLFLDAYMDRIAAAPPVGMGTADVKQADFVLVGHSHFDHLAGAEVIAQNTGAKIIGSNETCRVMREHGVPSEQLLASQGGERHRLAGGVTVRVFPSLHACLWAPGSRDLTEDWTGDLGLCEDDRATRFTARAGWGDILRGEHPRAQEILEHIRSSAGSRRDGGALVYLIETNDGSVFVQDTSGCWPGVLRGLHADVAILAISGRPNVDGEPFQGATAAFVALEADLLGASTVIPSHHDNYLGQPDVADVDLTPARDALSRLTRRPELVEPAYLDGTVIELKR